MRHAGFPGAAAALTLMLAAGAEPAASRGEQEIVVQLAGLEEDILPSITPTVKVRAMGSDVGASAVALGLQVALSPDFQGEILVDTLVVASDSATFQLRQPLPSGRSVFFRGNARTDQGGVYFSPISASKRVPAWLTLVAPSGTNGAVLNENDPTFVWSSARVSSPPGPWMYELHITETPTGAEVFSAGTSDTTLTLPIALEFNTSYRWSVTARLQNDESVNVSSRSSFVIVDENVPRATILYQTFPNPFPSVFGQDACIWFDLHAYAHVAIDVLDIRSNHVRRIFPRGADPRPLLPPGRYGRQAGTESGCSDEFRWDGTDDRGRTVLPGVYTLRFRAENTVFVKRMAFSGR